MKIILLLILFSSTILLYGDDDERDFDFSEPVGALLFAVNCLGCHQPASFIVTDPDEDYVEELADRIDYNIYSPMTGMSHLDFLSFRESREIARFLIYGSHIEGWVSADFHVEFAEKQGRDTCMKCHKTDWIKKYKSPDCRDCH